MNLNYEVGMVVLFSFATMFMVDKTLASTPRPQKAEKTKIQVIGSYALFSFYVILTFLTLVANLFFMIGVKILSQSHSSPGVIISLIATAMVIIYTIVNSTQMFRVIGSEEPITSLYGHLRRYITFVAATSLMLIPTFGSLHIMAKECAVPITGLVLTLILFWPWVTDYHPKKITGGKSELV